MEEDIQDDMPDLIPDIIPDVKKPYEPINEETEEFDDDYDDDYEEMHKVMELRKAVNTPNNIMELFDGIYETKNYVAHTKVGSHVLTNYSEKEANEILNSISCSVHVFTKGGINKDQLYENLTRILKKYSSGDKELEENMKESYSIMF